MRQRCTGCGSWGAQEPDFACPACDRPIVPDSLYRDPEIRAALKTHDFRVVFRAVRQHTHLSQYELAELAGVSQAMISQIERGERQLRDIGHVVRVASALRIPASLLGFTAEPGNLDDAEVSMERREFLSAALGITMSSALHPDLARLSETLPTHASTGRRQLGLADAEALERVTEEFRRTTYAEGGEMMCAAALAHLHAVRSADEARCDERTRERIDLATADLAWIAGWASWDAEQHTQAQQLWTFGLHRARRAEQHPRSTDLMIGILLDGAYQALQQDRDGRQARSALRLVELGNTVANTSLHSASASARTDLHASRAWCHGVLGHTDRVRAALSDEIEAFTAIEPDTVPPWARHVTDAEIASHRAHALALLAGAQPDGAPDAIEQLEAVVTSADLTYARTRAFHLPYLSQLYLLAGELEIGAQTGQDAITAINGLSSAHTRNRLHILADTAAAVTTASSAVAQLHDDIRIAVAP